MHRITAQILPALLACALAGCGETARLRVADGTGPSPQLPAPNRTLIPTLNVAKAIGWPAGGGPQGAPGTTVNAFATGLDHPRWLYVLPNGDVLVAETNAPPKPEDGKGIKGWRAEAGHEGGGRVDAEREPHHAAARRRRRRRRRDARRLPRDLQLAVRHGARRQRLLRRRFRCGDAITRTHRARRISTGRAPRSWTCRPAPINHHWTKNIVASADGTKLYVTVGSNSNVGENGIEAEEGRAAIWEIDPKTGAHRVFASGLRNPNGMAWVPADRRALWTVVNERDELGSDLVPDYMTSVKDGGFYGWPYSYYGQHVDDRVKPQRPDLVAKAIVPDYALGPHTASLGLACRAGHDEPAAGVRQRRCSSASTVRGTASRAAATR